MMARSIDSEALETIRYEYACKISKLSGVQDETVSKAFAAVPREQFVGKGPWYLINENGIQLTLDANPIHLYSNTCVALDKKKGKGINNGEPTLHMPLIEALSVSKGDHVVHIGAGTGYYTAILAHLTGPTGRVTAIEVDPKIANRLRSNLSGNESIEIICGNGIEADFKRADAIYVNAGATYPYSHWLNRLRPGGRLIIPLTPYSHKGTGYSGFLKNLFNVSSFGVVFLIQNLDKRFKVQFLSRVNIYPCVGMRNRKAEVLLSKAIKRGDPKKVKSLRKIDHYRNSLCWLHGQEICLSYRELE